jgi:putative membrane protein
MIPQPLSSHPLPIWSDTMKHSPLIAVSLLALTLGGCGKKNETTPMGEASEAIAAMPDAAVAIGPSQAFANAAAASDMFEIEASKLAVNKAGSAKVKRFAEQMIQAHTASTDKLKTAAATASPAIVPVAELSAAQQHTLADLRARSGAEFDTAYAKAQVDAHQQALDGLKSYSANGDVAALKKLATEHVPIVTAHLNMAKGL